MQMAGAMLCNSRTGNLLFFIKNPRSLIPAMNCCDATSLGVFGMALGGLCGAFESKSSCSLDASYLR